VTVFVNYRRGEAAGWARLLYQTLAAEFGAENVFLDQVTLEPGVRWLQSIRAGSSGCTAFLALIGPSWASALAARAESGEQDFVRSEIEAALAKDSPVREVIPALIEGATIPSGEDLRYVGSLKPLLRRQQAELRPTHWDADAAALIARLRQLAGVPAPAPTAVAPASAPISVAALPESAPPIATPPPAAVAPAPVSPPDPAHFEELARLILEEGSLVVPFLGPGANSCGRTEAWRDSDSAYLPDSEELAAYLAERLGTKPTPAGLALVSQSLSVAKGPGDLFMALRRALPPHQPPRFIHAFLAGLPRALHKLGAADRYQLIVTTNYDNALEQAFDEAEEPYDIAVYIARGREKGRFVHIPRDGKPQLVTDPNTYAGFPIDAFGRVERTVIMKVHGAVDRPQGPFAWRDNYVITEDDYIDYMSEGEIESIVPQQLLGKLRLYSHFLFLGHEMHDWSLRVFLIRIFGESGLSNTSWAVQREPTRLDERFWQRVGVDLITARLDEYAREAGEQLRRSVVAGRPR
jgi:SIR2-like domain/TIR domain